MKKITGAVRRAIHDYSMIQKGDCIGVGLSGGKDSIALLAALVSVQKYFPEAFTLKAITVDMGFEEGDFSEIAAYCNNLGIEYIIHKTNIAKVLFEIRKEKNPCSLCANLRRGALNNVAAKNGCNKVALGHHFDDFIETFFLSLFFEGRMYCFTPTTYLSRVGLTVIRPFMYIDEGAIKRFTERENLPVLHNPCPANGNTKREYIKNLISSFAKENDNFKTKIFGAVKKGLIDKPPL